MATAERVLDIARAELGNTEAPANSNRTKYGRWYGLDSQPWCMMFVQWCFHYAGVSLPARTASCGTLMRAAQKAGLWVTRGFQPGDVVIYDFSGKRTTTEHTGIVERVTASGVVSIEGNTSEAGSQSNGGKVCRKERRFSLIVGAVRPEFETEKRLNSTPSPAHEAGVEWAVKNGILTGDKAGNLNLSQPVTRQQLCTMLYRFAKLLGKA